jgi:hypothetical protein
MADLPADAHHVEIVDPAMDRIARGWEPRSNKPNNRDKALERWTRGVTAATANVRDVGPCF